MQGTIIFGLIFAILIAIFAIQNASIVALNILIWEFEISLAVVVLGSIIFGALVIGIFSYYKQFQLKRKNKNLKLEIQSLKEELDELKEEKRRLEKYSPESVAANSAQKAKESDKESSKEKRGFFGLGKKTSKEKEEKSEETKEETKKETETQKREDKSKDQDIAYNLEENDTEETEKNN